jgi:hypothetical protein
MSPRQPPSMEQMSRFDLLNYGVLSDSGGDGKALTGMVRLVWLSCLGTGTVRLGQS